MKEMLNIVVNCCCNKRAALKALMSCHPIKYLKERPSPPLPPPMHYLVIKTNGDPIFHHYH